MNLLDEITITCGHCGHVDTMDEFSRAPITGELPLGSYQCPKCSFAVRIRAPKERLYQDCNSIYPDHPDQIRRQERLIRIPTFL